jgi:hypothetical protein
MAAMREMEGEGERVLCEGAWAGREAVILVLEAGDAGPDMWGDWGLAVRGAESEGAFENGRPDNAAVAVAVAVATAAAANVASVSMPTSTSTPATRGTADGSMLVLAGRIRILRKID